MKNKEKEGNLLFGLFLLKFLEVMKVIDLRIHVWKALVALDALKIKDTNTH